MNRLGSPKVALKSSSVFSNAKNQNSHRKISTISSPIVTRLKEENSKVNKRIAYGTPRKFCTQVGHDLVEESVDVFLFKLLEKSNSDSERRKDVLNKIKDILGTAGIETVKHLKSRRERDLKKLGLPVDVVKEITKYFKSSAQFIEQSNVESSQVTSNQTETGESINSTKWVHTGDASNTAFSRNSEQFWNDFQDNRLEAAWLQTERISSPKSENGGDPLQWYVDWKKGQTGKHFNPQSLVFEILDTKEKSSVNASSSQMSIQSNTSKEEPNWIDNPAYHKVYFDALGKKLGVQFMDDWYKINITHVNHLKECKEILTKFYGNSFIRCLISVYPNVDWKINKFQLPELKEEFVDPAPKESKEAKDSRTEDFNTTLNRFKNHWQVRLFGNSKWTTLENVQHLPKELPKANPEMDEFLNPIFENENHLFGSIQELFPKEQVIQFYSNPKLIYSDTQRQFTLDAFIPKYNLAFEYLDDPNPSWQYASGAQYSLDTFYRAKRVICESLGITLVEVPSWWDKSRESLYEVIKKYRPEIDMKFPIKYDKSKNFFLSPKEFGMEKCRSCNSHFKSDTKYVIQKNTKITEKIWKPHFYCCDSQCISKANQFHEKVIPVLIPEEVKTEELCKDKGIQWIQM